MIVETAARLGVAGLVGLAVGLEREWSGHATGPQARFAGIRTFLLLGLIGGVAGWALDQGLPGLGVPILAGATLLAVSAYILAVRQTGSTDSTTEVAAIAVLALGAVAGVGHLATAGAVTAVIALALREKARIQAFLPRIGAEDLRATFQFAVLALVILPVLPVGPFGPFAVIRPRTIWIVVLLLSALNFAGYLARRAVGETRGFGIAGALGGLVSSTAVTLAFAQRSRSEPRHGPALGLGVLAACTILIPRVLVVSWALNPAVGLAILPALVLPLAVGLAVVLYLRRRRPEETEETDHPPVENPLQLWAALRMALLFQAVLLGLEFARDRFGEAGLYGTAAFMGLTDMDALTYSMSRMAGTTVDATVAARVVVVGVTANTVLKLAASLAIGSAGFRRVAGRGLAALALVTLAGLWVAFR